ncbi:EcoKI restriction-modification system protein HsdS [Lacunisphaera limnophila]|uniref:EcoKI restriction-modification system protein HsdS n=1 Tax=Lacunisphaera limnophila TaxID=1838286 RepID=A0A1D8AX56_9BACT|nr:restriction endonuclease subunit S [Lacunisphaera limnophila]AOS45456.1 EcoKI restriction-modification system protein HsdS [Lacunisphaera limnophila]
MELTTFFSKFDQFADAPDAVAKMRDLVLHLAVTGNLVRQNSIEQPADELLVEVRQSRDKLVKDGTIRRVEALPPLTNDDVPFECPAGWAWVRFGEISSSYRGHNPPKSLFKDKPSLGYVRFIQQRDFRTDDYAVYVPESRHLKLVKKGEIVMAAYGNIGNTCRTVEGAFNVAIAKVLEIPPVARDYIDLLIRSDFIRGALEKVSSRVAVSSMSSDHMRSLAVPLPPLAEQKRIVAKVGNLMALCDRLEALGKEKESRLAGIARASLARFADAPTPANLPFLFHPSYAIPPADLRKSILALAVQGKLVPQDPNDEPGEVILQRIHSDYSSKIRANQSEPNDDVVELPFELPKGWSASRLGSILNPKRGISYGVIKLGAEPQQGGVFILRCSNVRFRRIDLHGIRKVTEQLSSEFSRTILEGGEVLINVRGTLGGCAVVPPELKGYNIAREVAVIPVHTEIDPTFLLNVIASPFFQDRVDENLRGIAYEGLNLGLLRDFLIPIPPLAEQHRIVAKVEQLMVLVEALETQLAASRVTAANLLSALVAELTAAHS